MTVDVDKSEKLIRLLDTVVIKLEGGTDEDLKELDDPTPVEAAEKAGNENFYCSYVVSLGFRTSVVRILSARAHLNPQPYIISASLLLAASLVK